MRKRLYHSCFMLHIKQIVSIKNRCRWWWWWCRRCCCYTTQKYYFNCNPQMHSGEPIVLRCEWVFYIAISSTKKNNNKHSHSPNQARKKNRRKKNRIICICEKIQFHFSLVLEMRLFFSVPRFARILHFLLQYHHRVIVMIISNVSSSLLSFQFACSAFIITIVYIQWYYTYAYIVNSLRARSKPIWMRCAISQLCGCCLISFFFIIIIVVAVYSTITMFCFILFIYFCFEFFFRWIFSIPCVCKSHEICTIYRYYANNVFTEHKLRFDSDFFFGNSKNWPGNSMRSHFTWNNAIACIQFWKIWLFNSHPHMHSVHGIQFIFLESDI